MNDNERHENWERDCEGIEEIMENNYFLERHGLSRLVRCDPLIDHFKYNVIMEVVNKCECCGRYELRPLQPPFQLGEKEKVPEAIETKIIERSMDFMKVMMGDYDFGVHFDRDVSTCFYYLEK